MDTATAFGNLLRSMRAERGFSQQELAERAGLSENAISSFERAERFPRASTIDALVRALGTTAEEFLGDLLIAREERLAYGAAPVDPVVMEVVAVLRGQPEPVLRLSVELLRAVVSAAPQLQRLSSSVPVESKPSPRSRRET